LKAKFSTDVKWYSPVPVNRAIPVYVSREADPEEFVCLQQSWWAWWLTERKNRFWTPGQDGYFGAEPL